MMFTGKERDSETGLDFFGARYYSGAQGRWTTPDWSATPQPVPYADLRDPQTLNLYGYVRNNPLKTSDPDGHCEILCASLVAGTAVVSGIVYELHKFHEERKKAQEDADRRTMRAIQSGGSEADYRATDRAEAQTYAKAGVLAISQVGTSIEPSSGLYEVAVSLAADKAKSAIIDNVVKTGEQRPVVASGVNRPNAATESGSFVRTIRTLFTPTQPPPQPTPPQPPKCPLGTQCGS